MATAEAQVIAAMPEPEQTARAAGLKYVEPNGNGITRRRRGKGFSYHAPDGSLVEDETVRARIAELAIPPAWTEVWISPYPKGHLQATGRDAAGRRQYLYHDEFRAAREAEKFARLVPFGERLPVLRRRVGRDLALPEMPRDKVIAAGVRILDLAAIRVGNPEYERSNGSYGLMTLRRRHVDFGRKRAVLRFTGKGGREIEVELTDDDLLDVLRECDGLPGYRLFQYVDDTGEKRTLEVPELNAYLADALGGPFTAKEFRTWAGTTTAISALADREPGEDEAERRSTIVEVAELVGERLHNTPSVSRQSYIHPCVEDLYLAGTFHDVLAKAERRESDFAVPGRRREERRALALLTEV